MDDKIFFESIRTYTIAFHAWKVTLMREGFPRNDDGSMMTIWELYDYWDANIDKLPFRIYAQQIKK